jgi:hypothetical protein
MCNKACFDGKLIKSSVELIFYSVVFMNYWACLNNYAYQVALRAGAESLTDVAMAARDATPRPGDRARLGPGTSSPNQDASDDVLLMITDPPLRLKKFMFWCCVS